MPIGIGIGLGLTKFSRQIVGGNEFVDPLSLNPALYLIDDAANLLDGSNNPVAMDAAITRWLDSSTNANNATYAGTRPTRRSNGVQPGTARSMLFDAAITLPVTGFTAYFWGTYSAATDYYFIAGSSGDTTSAIYHDSSDFYLFDDTGGSISVTHALTPGTVLVKVRNNNGTVTVQSTGVSESTFGIALLNNVVPEAIFGRVGVSETGNTNRLRGALLFDTALSSQDMTDLETWLTANEGVSL